MDSSTSVLESQCDWLTVAVHSGTRTDWLAYRVKRWMTEEVARGNRVRPFRLNGYIGSQAGRVRWGERENAGLLQLSGQLATDKFPLIYPLRDTCTRIDLAVTVRTPVLDSAVALRHYAAAAAFRFDHPHAAMPSLVQDDDGGSTMYIGHRTSDNYLRCYNKQAECLAHNDKDGAAYYQNCWRYELECKGPTAEAVARQYSRRPDWPEFTRGYVHEFLVRHGIEPLFGHDGPPEKLLGFRRRSDRDTRLAWLAKSVRPTIRWLVENGDLELVKSTLDLGEEPREPTTGLTQSGIDNAAP